MDCFFLSLSEFGKGGGDLGICEVRSRGEVGVEGRARKPEA